MRGKVSVNNENLEYIVLRKDLYESFGLIKGMIVQHIIDCGGSFLGSTGSLWRIIGIASAASVKNKLKELVGEGVLREEHVHGWNHRWVLDEKFFKGEKRAEKHTPHIPDRVMELVHQIEEAKRKKADV